VGDSRKFVLDALSLKRKIAENETGAATISHPIFANKSFGVRFS
jgi:hypothetical protein